MRCGFRQVAFEKGEVRGHVHRLRALKLKETNHFGPIPMWRNTQTRPPTGSLNEIGRRLYCLI